MKTVESFVLDHIFSRRTNFDINEYNEFFRYKTILINSPSGWKPNEVIIRWTFFVILYNYLYSFLVLVINYYFDLKLSNIINVCLGQENTSSSIIWLNFTLTLLPVVTASISSCIIDIRSYLLIRKGGNKNYSGLPLRASLLSSFLILPYLFAAVILLRIKSIEIKYMAMIYNCLFFTTIRIPLVLRFGLKRNEINQQINQNEDREQRRQLEIEEALKRRQARCQPVEEVFTISEAVTHSYLGKPEAGFQMHLTTHQ